MLVLLSFALVLVATVLLVLGLLNDDGLTLIYLSIASSVAAAVVLLVALRLNKPKAEHRATAPAPLPDRLEPVAAGGDTEIEAEEKSEWLASEQESWPAADVEEGEEVEEVEFPIADYDTLTVGQILPLLPQLYPDEIGVVEERERLTKARPQVLAKLAELAESSRTAAAAEPVPAASAADPLASYTEAPAPAWDDDDDWFPIEDYESLSAAQIRPLLPELDDEELELVRTRELSLGRRRSLLDEIDRRLGTAEPAAAAAASSSSTRTTRATPAKTTAAKKAAPAKRTTATKATSKKSAPAKKATPAAKKATPAKKTTATKAAPAKKAAVKKAAPAKRAAPAKKATPAAKQAAPAKKATPAKRATTKKAAKKR